MGYQILYGAGRGLGLQMVGLIFPLIYSGVQVVTLVSLSQPIIAVQNTVAPQQLPIAMALITFSQSFGASLSLSFAETIFGNSFATLIPQYAPSVNSQSVIDAGATAFRDIVSGSDLAGVLTAYAISIDRVFYMAAALGAGCFAFAWGMGWQNMRKQKAVSKA